MSRGQWQMWEAERKHNLSVAQGLCDEISKAGCISRVRNLFANLESNDPRHPFYVVEVMGKDGNYIDVKSWDDFEKTKFSLKSTSES